MKPVFFSVMVGLLVVTIGCATAQKTQSTDRLIAMSDNELMKEILHAGVSANPKDVEVIRAAFVRKHPEWPPDVQQAIARKNVKPGMTLWQVFASLGPPDDFNTRQSIDGSSVTMIYRHSRYTTQYIYVGPDSKVTSIQTY